MFEDCFKQECLAISARMKRFCSDSLICLSFCWHSYIVLMDMDWLLFFLQPHLSTCMGSPNPESLLLERLLLAGALSIGERDNGNDLSLVFFFGVDDLGAFWCFSSSVSNATELLNDKSSGPTSENCDYSWSEIPNVVNVLVSSTSSSNSV